MWATAGKKEVHKSERARSELNITNYVCANNCCTNGNEIDIHVRSGCMMQKTELFQKIQNLFITRSETNRDEDTTCTTNNNNTKSLMLLKTLSITYFPSEKHPLPLPHRPSLAHLPSSPQQAFQHKHAFLLLLQQV